MKVGILTDFINHDPAYSLCGVVLNQLKMLRMTHIPVEVTVFVRADPNVFTEAYGSYSDRIVQLNPGKTGSNTVDVTNESDAEIEDLYDQFILQFNGIDVMLTHDLIYQANMWKYHVAARRYAAEHPMRWLHWIHSSTAWDVKGQTGKFEKELEGKFPNAKLVAFHDEEINRKGTMYGYERDEIVVIPNPLDVMADYHEDAQRILRQTDFWKAELIAVYPARLDRGKQIEVVCEIFRELRNSHWDARVIVVDFHSTAGDKAVYRHELKDKYSDFLYFTSDLEGLSYHVLHQAVMDLFDYADVFIHPSRSEADPLTVPEAMWKGNLLVLNFDLPLMRQWQGQAIMGKFSSNIDVNSGMPGETNTEYGNRKTYMRGIADAILYHAKQNPILLGHRQVRNERSIEASFWKTFWPVVSGGRG